MDDVTQPTEPDIPHIEGRRRVTVTEIIEQCNRAADQMSHKNPNRVLLRNCAYIMVQLTDRLAKYEGGTQ